MQETSVVGGHLHQTEEQLLFDSGQEQVCSSPPIIVAAVYSSGRSINASMAERSILLGVMAHNLGVLDSRENDTVTVLRKSQLWDEVTREFNNRTGTPRSRQQIQTLYKNMKAKARRYQARLAEIGIPPPEPDPNSEMLLALLQAQLQQQRTFLHNVTIGTEHPVINLESPGKEKQILIDEKSGVPQGNIFVDDTNNNGTCDVDDKSDIAKSKESPMVSIIKHELEARGIEQPFTMDGISNESMLQNKMTSGDSMKPSITYDAQDMDKDNNKPKASKRKHNSGTNALDEDDAYAFVNPHQLMQVCLKEEILPNTVKIEPADVDQETHMIEKHKESSPENTDAASSSKSDPLTFSDFKGFNSVSSPLNFMERNPHNHNNILSKTFDDNLDLIRQNGSITPNSLFSTNSEETVQPMIPSIPSTPSMSTILSSAAKRPQPSLSYKRRRYSLYEDSGSSNQQTVHTQGNSSKVCCCPEFHKELVKLEREESNLRCQLLEEERVACTKEHEARMRLIAMEEKLVKLQLKKIQSELDEKPTVPSEVDHIVCEQKNKSYDFPNSNENEHTSGLSSNSKQRSESNRDSLCKSKTSIFDTVYVS